MMGLALVVLALLVALTNAAASGSYLAAYERSRRPRHGWSCIAFAVQALGWLLLCYVLVPVVSR